MTSPRLDELRSMLIFTTITDRLDACPEDDDSWLTAAEQVLQRCDPAAVPALLGSLAAIVGDRSLPQVQARRCRRLVGDASADAWDEHEPVERHDRFCAIQSVVAAAIDYQRHVPPRQAELGRWYRPPVKGEEGLFLYTLRMQRIQETILGVSI